MQRRSFFVDVDERVRRAAFEAALEAPSEADLDALLESARLDPDALGRSLAARAVGASGGERAVLSLLDAWDRADEETKLSIVEAWSTPPAWSSGGERELLKVAESGTGLPALAAAAAVLRNGGTHAGAATTLLVRAIAQGASDERRAGITLAPISDAEVLRVIKEAAKDPDLDVRVMALARLLDLPEQRASAQKELKKLAQTSGNIAEQARAALAALGDESVRPALLAALREKKPGDRQVAALGLVRLGDYSSAASVLGDDDATTRATLACTILAREEHSH
jgi:HEAT repeat protein